MNTSTEPDKQAKSRTRKKRIAVFLIAVALLGAGFAVYHFVWGQYAESTDNAYVAGDMVVVSSQIASNVKAVVVDDNQQVQAGQLLVTLDETDASLALTQATAKLADTVRSVRSLFDQVNINRAGQQASTAEITRAQDQVARFQAEAKRLQSELARRELAYKQELVSAEELEMARSAMSQAKSQLSAAQAAKKQAQAGLTQSQASLSSALNQTRDVQIAEHPKVLQAISEVREAHIRLQRCQIVAPIAGQVAKRAVQTGMRVTPGTPLLTVVPLDQVWVDANFKENQLARIRLGQPVTLKSDLDGGESVYRGKVAGFSAGTGSAFSMLPAQNATGNWIKIVQRLPVRIEIEPQDLKKSPLRIGLSMDVEVDTHEIDGPKLMSASPKQRIRQTEVFDDMATRADAHVQALLAKELAAP